MMIVGLTGGIGSGKTTIANMFSDLKVPVYNSDTEAKLLMMNSKSLRTQIKALLGKESYVKKELNRKYIADKVFVNPNLLSELNKIVHPAVREHFITWMKMQNSTYIIQEAAVIFENDSQSNYDKIILVTAPEEIRLQRVIKRDEISAEKVKERIANQWTDSEKARLSDFIIENLDLKKSQIKVLEIHNQLLKTATISS